MKIPELLVERIGGNWWIVSDDMDPMGPYGTKDEAESDRLGLLRFYKHCGKPGWVTSEKPK